MAGADPLAPLTNSFGQNSDDNPFAQCALDQAIHDLWGKQQGKPVYQLWGLDPANNPLSNFTIAIDAIDKMVEKLHEVPDWPIYKIKLGTPHDIEIITALRDSTQLQSSESMRTAAGRLTKPSRTQSS